MERGMVNKVYQGDCLEVMKEFPNESIDMILCDLPYGSTQNSWDEEIDLLKLWKEYARLIKPRGVIALTGYGLFTGKLIMSNPDMFRYKIVWIKSVATNFLNANKQPLRKHEDICIFYREQPRYRPQKTNGKPYDRGYRKGSVPGNYGAVNGSPIQNLHGLKFPSDVQYFPEAEIADHLHLHTAKHQNEALFHPTQKPLALGRWLIRSFTGRGDLILDNACGSGSFLCAAILEFRDFIGIEKNENCSYMGKPIDYIQVCQQRIFSAYQQRNSLLDF